MDRRSTATLATAGIVLGILAPPAHAQWPELRGPTGDGHAPEEARPPLTWSETENVAWKVAVPGEGFSSPVVVGGTLLLTTALEEERSLRALAYDVASGALLWDVEVFRPEAWAVKHSDNSYASPTPVVDGDRGYVHFGSYGTAALSLADGRVLAGYSKGWWWTTRPGRGARRSSTAGC